MSDQFKGKIYVTSNIDKDRFEQAAYRCGYSVAITMVEEEKYHLVFYTKEGKTDGSEDR